MSTTSTGFDIADDTRIRWLFWIFLLNRPYLFWPSTNLPNKTYQTRETRQYLFHTNLFHTCFIQKPLIGLIFSFAEENIEFQCHYARTVSTNSTIEVESTSQSQPIIGNGTLPYDIDVAVGDLGGTSVVTISPNHSFGNQIAPRYVFNFSYSVLYDFILSN